MAAITEETQQAARESESKCYLLGLPAEIRNQIFEDVFTTDHDAFTSDHGAFTPDHDGEATIDLLAAQPPEKALVFTCRQVYGETRQMFRTAYRSFWSKTTFKFSIAERNGNGEWSCRCEDRHRVNKMDEEDIAHITKMCVNRACRHTDPADDGTAVILFRDGVGHHMDHGHTHDRYLLSAPPGSAEQCPAGTFWGQFRRPGLAQLLHIYGSENVKIAKETLGLGDDLRKDGLFALAEYYCICGKCNGPC